MKTSTIIRYSLVGIILIFYTGTFPREVQVLAPSIFMLLGVLIAVLSNKFLKYIGIND